MNDLELLEARLAERIGAFGRPLTLREETASTNDDAKAGARAGAPHGALWVADVQTQGRGRQGRVWMCEPGMGLLFSLLLRVQAPAARLPPLALACGLAVRDAVARVAPSATIRIKWPNDVVAGDERKKVAGILLESGGGALVVGVGVNVHGKIFPDAIRDRATSVVLLADAPPTRQGILLDFLDALEPLVPLVLARGLAPIHARLAAADALAGQLVKDDAGKAGRASGIDTDGRLLVRREDGTLERWGAGEVHLV